MGCLDSEMGIGFKLPCLSLGGASVCLFREMIRVDIAAMEVNKFLGQIFFSVSNFQISLLRVSFSNPYFKTIT